MPDRAEAERRKALRRGVEARQRAQEEAGLPISKESLWALFDHLDAALEEGCDHSLRHTKHFLASHELPVESVVPWLGQYGGYCDCEVLFNVEDRWHRP